MVRSTYTTFPATSSVEEQITLLESDDEDNSGVPTSFSIEDESESDKIPFSLDEC